MEGVFQLTGYAAVQEELYTEVLRGRGVGVDGGVGGEEKMPIQAEVFSALPRFAPLWYVISLLTCLMKWWVGKPKMLQIILLHLQVGNQQLIRSHLHRYLWMCYRAGAMGVNLGVNIWYNS